MFFLELVQLFWTFLVISDFLGHFQLALTFLGIFSGYVTFVEHFYSVTPGFFQGFHVISWDISSLSHLPGHFQQSRNFSRTLPSFPTFSDFSGGYVVLLGTLPAFPTFLRTPGSRAIFRGHFSSSSNFPGLFLASRDFS